MESTRQITKAMELVASSKLRGAQERALNNRKYFQKLFDAMSDIAVSTPDFASVYMSVGSSAGKPLYIVIAGDRGLAGGYNNNIFKLAMINMEPDAAVIPVGKKALDYFKKRNFEVITESLFSTEQMTANLCFTVANGAAKGFKSGKYSSVTIIYTRIDSVLNQTACIKKVLPLRDLEGEPNTSKGQMIFEGGEEAFFDAIVPEYMGGLLYSAIKESFASEQAARRTAMDSASKNADSMISGLNLEYNRARQAAITQEITEIVAGSES